MAGDWIKMQLNTPEKAEVLALTDKMGWDDPDLTVGKLFRLWRWFDQHTTEGNAKGVSAALVDRMVGVTGFCEAVQSVGWMQITDQGLTLVNFGRHNGVTAKKRGETARRVAAHKERAAGARTSNAKGNAKSVSDALAGALPREEKRREEESPNGDSKDLGAASAPNAKAPKGVTPKDSPATKPEGVSDEAWAAWLAHRKRRRASASQIVLDDMAVEAAKLGWTLEQAIRKQVAAGWQGFEADWVRREQQRSGGAGGSISDQKLAARKAGARTIYGDEGLEP